MLMLLLMNQVLIGTKIVHRAGNGDEVLMLKTIFLFSFLQQVNKEGVIEIHERNHKSLLQASLAHQNSQTPFRGVFGQLLMVMMKMEVRHDDLNISTHRDETIKKLVGAGLVDIRRSRGKRKAKDQRKRWRGERGREKSP